MLRPPSELPDFEKTKIMEQKIKSSYSPLSKKLKQKMDYQNLVRQSHKLFIKINLKQIQRKRPHIQKIEYSQHTKKKTHRTSMYKSGIEKI